ncbi:nuclear transport factor 2 family protein [Mucilaginibacter sp. CSA2-8R]|uniref:nuclear transport factor 2 family protein n=1 Tax=Mucilaginibacter sp. CSA2-8R TaxID=3141542 RepID=UPI00315CA1D7
MINNSSLKSQELIKKAYQAFNNRNIDTILQMMHSDIKWSRAWEGDYARGHDEVKAYWQRQWQEINPKVTPVTFVERTNGTLAVEVDQLVIDLEGRILFDGKVKHIYTIENGLLKQMDIEQH